MASNELNSYFKKLAGGGVGAGGPLTPYQLNRIRDVWGAMEKLKSRGIKPDSKMLIPAETELNNQMTKQIGILNKIHTKPPISGLPKLSGAINLSEQDMANSTFRDNLKKLMQGIPEDLLNNFSKPK